MKEEEPQQPQYRRWHVTAVLALAGFCLADMLLLVAAAEVVVTWPGWLRLALVAGLGVGAVALLILALRLPKARLP